MSHATDNHDTANGDAALASTMGSGKCLNPECDRSGIHRGLCKPCYQVARRLVESKRTTWKALQTKGKVLPTNGGRPSPTIDWLLK